MLQQVEVYIYTDNNGKPGNACSPAYIVPLTDLYDENTGAIIVNNIPGWISLDVTPHLTLTPNTNYWVVAREIVPAGEKSLFSWGAYSNANSTEAMYSSDGRNTVQANWSEIGGKHLFFKVFYEAPVITTKNDTNVVFGDGKWRACKAENTLTTEMKAAVILVIDDSKSFASTAGLNTTDLSLRLITKRDKIKHLINKIFEQTNNNAYIDIWMYGKDIVNTGFINDLDELLEFVELVYNNGSQSNIFETVSRAISGLNYQSIIEAHYGQDAVVDNQKIHWVKEFTPVILVLSDGESSGIGSIDDVVASANSTWDIDGVKIHCLGWGEAQKQSSLRTIADKTNGKYFNIDRLYQWISCHTIEENLIYSNNHGLVNNTAIMFALGVPDGLRADTIYYAQVIDEDKFYVSITEDGTTVDLVSNTEYKYCQLDDWAIATNSLLHGGDNSIFIGEWNKSFDFSDPEWIKYVKATFSSVGNSVCEINYQYTKDRVNWSGWIKLNNNVESMINDLVYGLRFNATLKDGWNEVTHSPIVPTIDKLEYANIIPSKQYYITPAHPVTGMIFEYILSASAELPSTARVKWGLCRGDSNDFADFEILYNGRNCVLPNRQYGIRFTSSSIREKLPTTEIGNNTFQVMDESGDNATSWGDNDVISLYIDDIQVALQFSADPITGLIILPNTITLPDDSVLQVSILTPSAQISFAGEPTYTYDYRTYYSSNGRWPKDATAIILINNRIVRGGYFVSADAGTVTFVYALEATDNVSLYIEHAPKYRLGVEITNYDDKNSVIINNIGMYFSSILNAGLLDSYANSPMPYIENISLGSNNNSVYERLLLSYDFKSDHYTRERGSHIQWYLQSNGEGSFVEIPDYNNRITQKRQDVWVVDGDNSSKLFAPGDCIKVIVTPSDGLTVGKPLESNVVTLTSGTIPVAWDLDIVGSTVYTDEISHLVYALPNDTLIASYLYYSSGGSDNDFIIEWYINDVKSLFTGPSIIATTGNIISYSVTPKQGEVVGYTLWSNSVHVK